MANNNIEAWKDEYVAITDANYCSKSVKFGDLLPILMEKPDVFEDTDWYTYGTAGEFVGYYSTKYSNAGYGSFLPDI